MKGAPGAASADYYDANAQSYFDATINADVSALRARFLAQLQAGARILDAGCGSGRDARAFKEHGFDVVALDASGQIARLASAHTGLQVHVLTFDEIQWVNEFDGIWASASLLHVPRDEQPHVFSLFARALKQGGTWYLSLKEGETDRWTDGRLFTDMTPKALNQLLQGSGLLVEDIWVTDDVRPGRNERWVNALARART